MDVPEVVLRLLVRVAEADGVLGAGESEMLLRVAGTLGLAEDHAVRTIEAELAAASDPEALGWEVATSGHARSVYALGCTLSLVEGEVGARERGLLDAFARGAGLTPEDAETIRAEMARAAADDD
jgi:tellurite resistance protein